MAGHQDAIIHIMVIMSAADRDMKDVELQRMTAIVSQWPVFAGYDVETLPRVAQSSAQLLQDDHGLAKLMDDARASLPSTLIETAYAAACDIAAADGKIANEEAQLLELIRHRLHIDRLSAAAIERGARARHARI